MMSRTWYSIMAICGSYEINVIFSEHIILIFYFLFLGISSDLLSSFIPLRFDVHFLMI